MVVAGMGILASVVVYNSRTDVEAEDSPKKTTFRKAVVTKTSQKRARRRPGGTDAQKIVQTRIKSKELERPTFEIDDDDEATLNEEQRKMIEAIRAALDAEDRKSVLRLVQKMQSSDEWPDGIPKSIKLAAIRALGWFGVSCLPEVAGFLGDSDSEVVQSAVERFEEALSDIDLSDRERAAILIQAAKVINDPEVMDSMLFELNNMRHSVGVETIKTLMAEGNAASKQVLADNVEFFTGEEGMDSPEKLDEWLKENPDDEDDEEFYGGTK